MLKLHLIRILIGGAIGALLGVALYFVSPPIYEASLVVILGKKVQEGTSPLSAEVQDILGSSEQDPQSEIAFLASRWLFQRSLIGYARNLNKEASPFSPIITPQDELDLGRNLFDASQQDALFSMYDVQNDGLSSTAVLTVKAWSPEQAKDLVSAVYRTYKSTREADAKERVEKAIQYLTARTAEARSTLEKKEAELAAFSAKTGTADLPTALADATRNETALKNDLSSLRSEIDSLEAQIRVDDAMLRQMPETIEDSVISTKSPLIDQYESQLAALRSERGALLARYYEDSPKVKRVDAQIASLTSALGAERQAQAKLAPTQTSTIKDPVRLALRTRLQENRSRVSGLRRSLEVKQAGLLANQALQKRLSSDDSAYRDIARERNLIEQRYALLKQQLEELSGRRLQAEQALAPLTASQTPIASDRPVAPDMLKLIFIGAIAGLCVGTIFSFSLESLRLRIHSSTQLEALTGLPVVATLPPLSRSQTTKHLKALSGGEGEPSEAFRYIAVSMFSDLGTKPSMVMLTSLGPSLQRTSSAVQLAIATSRAGIPTLLIDADFRRFAVTQIFGLRDQAGLSDILQRGSLPSNESESLGVATKIQNLMVLPIGSDGKAHLSDFGLQLVREWFESLKSFRGLVIVDAPSCLDSSDAAVICGAVDEVFLVASANKSPHRLVPSAYEVLKRAGAKNVSLVMTDATDAEEPFFVQQGVPSSPTS